jgi:uncharacterized membrane protein
MHSQWTLQRNCSLSPRQVALAYALLCTGALTVGIGFLLHGVWQVLAFTLPELSLVGLALLLYARHALDHDAISLGASGLTVDCVRAGSHHIVRLDPLWVSVQLPDDVARPLLRLESRGIRVEIGRFVCDARRRQVARELRLALRGISVLA